jgi:hypothetical protein
VVSKTCRKTNLILFDVFVICHQQVSVHGEGPSVHEMQAFRKMTQRISSGKELEKKVENTQENKHQQRA